MKLFLKAERCYSGKCPVEKRGAVPPGQHGQRKSRRPSDYAQRLREKQKGKRIYGVLEKQFSRYFDQAMKVKGATGKALLQFLESRLDNVVYRLGFVPSRSVARQLINHGHISVDGKRVNVASYRVRPGQTVQLRDSGMKIAAVKKHLAEKKKDIPDWLKRKAVVGQMLRLPEREEIGADVNEQLIVEFYSR
jgi:small subunit ribosomal protein S4